MSKGQIHPSTLDGIKRYAKTLKAERGLTHAQALDAAAVEGGFQNYVHARRELAAAKPRPGFVVYISVPWRDREADSSGQEVLSLRLAGPLTELVKPAHLKSARHLGGFQLDGEDHLGHHLLAQSQSDARRRACAAARTLAFMEATGLRPSAGRSRAYPRGDFSKALPGKDHYSEWYDPAAKAYVFADEPYRAAVTHRAEEREAWSREHGWALARSTWPGMYNPDGGCELYLAADTAKGYSLTPVLQRLAALPPPIVEATWDGQSLRRRPVFVSPAYTPKAATPKRAPAPRAKRSPNATVAYGTLFGRASRRRPAKRMPIAGHAEVGRLLKSVIAISRERAGVYNRLDSVRSDLDDWVQREYTTEELPGDVFFELYYHEDISIDRAVLRDPQRRAQHADSLAHAKVVLARHYADCAPVRALFKKLDDAAASLTTWMP